jgi:glycosyltransferase involved in cell wall biosynthesis
VNGQTPRVSVVLAARDESESIRVAVDSILAQTLRDWELIVVDDGSRDGTADIVRAYADKRIRVLVEAGRGLPASLNCAIAHARAAVIARQDADDVSLPDRLERQACFLDEHEDVAVVAAAWRELGPDGQAVRPRTQFVGGRLNEGLLHFNPIVHTSAMFRRDVVMAIGGYDESLPYAADYDLWLRLDCAGAVLWNLDETLVVRRMTGRNMSSHRERANLREELRIRWNDLGRRRRLALGTGPGAIRLAVRAPRLLVPLCVRRAVRRGRSQVP